MIRIDLIGVSPPVDPGRIALRSRRLQVANVAIESRRQHDRFILARDDRDAVILLDPADIPDEFSQRAEFRRRPDQVDEIRPRNSVGRRGENRDQTPGARGQMHLRTRLTQKLGPSE